MLSALLERMGKNPNRIVYTVTDEEHLLLDIRKKIWESINQKNVASVRKYLYEYAKIPKIRSKRIHKQFEFGVKGEIYRLSGNPDGAINSYKEALAQTISEKDYNDINDSLYTVLEFGLLFKIGEMKDYDFLFKLGYYLKRLSNDNYLKVVFYGDIIEELIRKSKDKWMKQMQLEYIEDALQYKRMIKQSRGIVRLLELKRDCQGTLNPDEEIISRMTELLGC
jgi:tetratricopeptide (TPR) repeat protein